MSTYRQDVSDSHRTTYANTIQMVKDQNQSWIRDTVTILDGDGEMRNVRDLLDKREYVEFEDYDDETPDNRSKLTAVWVHRPKAIGDGQVIRKEDKFDMAMDPTSSFNRGMVRGVEKGVYDRIMGIKMKDDGTFGIHGAGIMGDRYAGAKGGTPAGLPASQYLPDGGVGLTSNKLIDALEKLHIKDWGMDEEDLGLCCPIAARQISDLLRIAKEAGASLNEFDILQLQTGKPTVLLGITWKRTNRLAIDSSGNRLLPLYSKENIAAVFWQDIMGSIRNRTDKRGNPPYVEIDAFPTCTRIEDDGVAVIPCVES